MLHNDLFATVGLATISIMVNITSLYLKQMMHQSLELPHLIETIFHHLEQGIKHHQQMRLGEVLTFIVQLTKVLLKEINRTVIHGKYAVPLIARVEHDGTIVKCWVFVKIFLVQFIRFLDQLYLLDFIDFELFGVFLAANDKNFE